MGRRVITRQDVERAPLMEYTKDAVRVPVAKEPGEEDTGVFGHMIDRAVSQVPSSEKEDDYVTKVIKYIPAEIVAAFVTVDGVLRSVQAIPKFVGWMVFLVLLVLTPLYVWRVTSDPAKPPATGQIVVATISFFLWVFALGGPFNHLSWYLPAYGAIVLPIYTVLVPIVAGR